MAGSEERYIWLLFLLWTFTMVICNQENSTTVEPMPMDPLWLNETLPSLARSLIMRLLRSNYCVNVGYFCTKTSDCCRKNETKVRCMKDTRRHYGAYCIEV